MPKIVTRQEALKMGLKTYFTGRPCKKGGHLSERRTNSSDCLECVRVKVRVAGCGLKRMQKREKNLQDRYGISLLDYQNLLIVQNNRCACCGNLEKQLVVDHCHDTGKVRGLLCSRCNNLIGLAKDNTHVLQCGIDYLLKTT